MKIKPVKAWAIANEADGYFIQFNLNENYMRWLRQRGQQAIPVLITPITKRRQHAKRKTK